jgi:hypothetical protein
MRGFSAPVPWWGAIVIAVVAALSGLVIVLIQNSFQSKNRKRVVRHEAYEEFIAASQVLAFRTELFGSQKSVVASITNTISDLQKALLVLFLGTVVERASNSKWKILGHFFEAIPTPIPARATTDSGSLRTAYEALIGANVKVRLYGSTDALEVSERLLVHSQEYFRLVESKNWTWTGLPAQSVLSEARDKMIGSASEFLALARSEFDFKESMRNSKTVNGIARGLMS